MRTDIKPTLSLWYYITSLPPPPPPPPPTPVYRSQQPVKLSLSQRISRFIADLLFSVVMEVLFLMQVSHLYVVPTCKA